MKHTKREWMPLYSFLDRKRVTDHLADMAARGWMLDRLGTWSWHYRRTEPKQLRFAVTFFAGAGRFSPAPAAGRAEAAVEAGLPLPDLRSARGLGILVLMWSGLLIAGLFASISRSTGMVILTIGMVLFFALVYFLANAARKALQRLRCPPWANLLVIVGICIAMFAGGTTGLFALMIRNAGSGWLEDHPPVETYTAHGMTWSVYADPIPLRVEDLVDIDYDGWSTEADVEWSPLAAHGEYRQDARLGDGDLPELRYEIVTVKLPFLYGLCKRDFIQWVERDNDQLPMEYWEEYRTVTAAPWGAEEVFQRYSGAEPVNQFLLCWPDRMAEVKLPWDWRLTADQMAVIGEKLLYA